MASAIWKVIDRPWRTILAPIFTGRWRSVVIDHCLTPSGSARVRRKRVASDWAEFCGRFVGLDAEKVSAIVNGVEMFGYEVPIPVAQILGPHGGARTKRDEGGQACDRKLAHGTVEHWKARLRRDSRELAARVETGELSADAAAIQAGWRRKSTPLYTLRRAWRHTPADERATLS